MRPPAQLQAAIELLEMIEQQRHPADRMMSAYYRSRRYIGSKDKAAISETTYSILRQKGSLSWLALESGFANTPRSWVLINMLLEKKDPQEWFLGDDYSPRSLSGNEKNAAKYFNKLSLNDALINAPIHARLNLPEWLLPHLQASLGDDFEAEMRVLQERANMDVRVNTLKSDRETVQQMLAAEGVSVSATQVSPWGLTFNQKVSLNSLKSFNDGLYEVQDQGSQLIALAIGVSPGEKVVDFCAGAGGKTLAMAAQMQNKGVLHACDVHTKRLENLAKRKKRAGAHNIQTHIFSSECDKWVKRNAGKMDVVLVDAPCTGTGTWRRNPDARWNLEPENLVALQALQSAIVESAARLVREGGKLVYATCSILREENEDCIMQFLEQYPHFEAGQLAASELFESVTVDGLNTVDGYQLRTSTAKIGMDGFFVCVLKRKHSSA